MESKGIISNIQLFSTGDGPGIRTTVFFKGCNLACQWCHNPETISAKPQLLYYEQLCAICGACQRVCPRQLHFIDQSGHCFDRYLCEACGACAAACPSGALVICGGEKHLSDIMDVILADADFYLASGGGVTLSGGEPLLQAEFAAAIASECKKHRLHIIIDTAGNVDFTAFLHVIPFTDVFYFDLKGAKQEDYAQKTGGSLMLVLDNMARLIANGCQVVARIPIIPGYNDRLEYCDLMAELLLQVGCRQVHLLPFHRLGSGKYRALGLSWCCQDMEPPGSDRMETLRGVFIQKGFMAEVEG